MAKREISCVEVIDALIGDVEDNSIDISTILSYLAEKTDFIEWLENNRDELNNDYECDGDCENCDHYDPDYEEDEVDIKHDDFVRLQMELKDMKDEVDYLRDELASYKKKYANLQKKYKGAVKSSN